MAVTNRGGQGDGRQRVNTSALHSVFFFSGFAALIYQVVWQRLLTVHYGVGPWSIALVVSIFMFGLGVGGYFGGRLSERLRHLPIIYATIELVLGIFGAASLWVLDWLGSATAQLNYFGMAFACAAFLLIPTFLMGATLPIIVKYVNGISRSYIDSLGRLYFVNTLGAAFGAFVTAFVLLSFFDMRAAIAVAVAVNLVLAVVVFALFGRDQGFTWKVPSSSQNHVRRDFVTPVALLIAFTTGFIAMGYQIFWFNVIGVLLKSSAYVFATTLTVYLLGLAFGGYFVRSLVTNLSPGWRYSVFFILQIGIAVAALFPLIAFQKWPAIGALVILSDSHELHPPMLSLSRDLALKQLSDHVTQNGLFSLLDVFFWPIFFVPLATFLMGASFPLASSLYVGDSELEGQDTGSFYLANVLGNTAGALVTGFILVETLGLENLVVVLYIAGCALILACRQFGERPVGFPFRVAAFALCLVPLVFFTRHGLLYPPDNTFDGVHRFLNEGRDGVVASARRPNGGFSLSINGLGYGGRSDLKPGLGTPAYYIFTMQSMNFAPDLRNILEVGIGTGSTLEPLVLYPGLKTTLVELNQTLMDNLRKQEFFQTLFSQRSLEIVIDDVRRFLNRFPDRRFDAIILGSPVRPTTVMSNNLFSLEFMELAKSRLEKGGVLSAQVFSDEQIHTIATVFPYTIRTCGFYIFASVEPLLQKRSVEPHIISQFGAEFERTVTERAKLCGEPQLTGATFNPKVPYLTDRAPAMEFHIGRAFRVSQ